MWNKKRTASECYELHDWYPYAKAMGLLEGKGLGGIYWIRLAKKTFHYRKGGSPVIYIGASESNIRRRLKTRLEKRDRQGICNVEQGSLLELEVSLDFVLDRAIVRSWEQTFPGAFRDKYDEVSKCNTLQLQ